MLLDLILNFDVFKKFIYKAMADCCMREWEEALEANDAEEINKWSYLYTKYELKYKKLSKQENTTEKTES